MISDDEDDEDAEFQRQIEHAIKMSKVESSASEPHIGAPSTSNSAQPRAEALAQNAGTTSSIFLSEKALLEKERLERQKRLRRDAGLDDRSDAEGPSKRQYIYSSPESLTNGASEIEINAAASGSHSTSNLGVPTIEQTFWEGEVRQTANRYAEPRKDGQPTFRLTDVIGKVRPVDIRFLPD